jgi:hypothetical protein
LASTAFLLEVVSIIFVSTMNPFLGITVVYIRLLILSAGILFHWIRMHRLPLWVRERPLDFFFNGALHELLTILSSQSESKAFCKNCLTAFPKHPGIKIRRHSSVPSDLLLVVMMVKPNYRFDVSE